MHLRLDGVLPPSSTRTVEREREFISNTACKVLIDPASLLSILKNIYQWANETIRQLRPAHSFTAMNTVRDSNLNTGITRSNNQEREEIPPRLEEENIEDISIHFLCTCSTHPNWKQIVSSRNEYGQTMAHICVTLGYFRLLQHLCTWEIDINAVDQMGSTALHYAYLFQQEKCVKVLIHSGVDQFILDDLGRSPSDLDPSLEVRARPNMDMDMDSSAEGAPPIECDTEMPDEAEKLFAKHFLIQQWTLQDEYERRVEVPLSRCQSQETSSPPATDATDEGVWGIRDGRSPRLDVCTPEGRPTPAVAEEIDVGALAEIATPPHIAHPPSPVSEFSPQTQEIDRPPDTGQNPSSHSTPLGDTRDLEDLRSIPGSHIEPTDITALDNAGKDVWKFVSLHPHDLEPFTVDQAAMDIIGLDPMLWAPANTLPFETSTSQHAVQPFESGSSLYIDAPVLGSSRNLDSLIPPLESHPIVLYPAEATPPQSSRLTFEPLALEFMQPLASRPALSDDEARSLINEYIMAAPWFHEHTQEPLVGGEGVPTCALQLAPKGESVYRCFVVPGKSGRNKPVFKCATCAYTSDRLSPMIGHQRVKRNHRPFACGDVGW